MSVITLDTETIPRQDLKPDPEMVKAPSNYKDPFKIEAYKETHAEDAYRKLSLDYLKAQIIVISAADGDSEPVVFSGEDEEALILAFDKWLDDLPTNTPPYALGICGHNVTFDMTMLYIRACKYKAHNVAGMCSRKPFDELIYDTMRMAYPTQRNEYVSMDALCEFFGIEGKGEIDGSKVYNYFLEGKLSEIAEYCKSDVEKTRQIYNLLI